MPDVRVDEDDVVPPEEAVVKVTAEGLGKGSASWYLGYGADIEIGDDGPNHVTVETAPFEEDIDDG